MNLKFFILGIVPVAVAISACATGPSTPLPADSTSPGLQMPDNGFKTSEEKESELTDEEKAARQALP